MMFKNGRPPQHLNSPGGCSALIALLLFLLLFLHPPSLFLPPLPEPELAPEFGGQLRRRRCTHQMIAEGGILC